MLTDCFGVVRRKRCRLRGDRRATSSREPREQGGEVFFGHDAGPVGARLEIVPAEFLLAVFGVEEHLLFDQVAFKQRLIETVYRAMKNVRMPEVFGRDRLFRRLVLNLDDAAAQTHLNQVRRILAVHLRIELSRHE